MKRAELIRQNQESFSRLRAWAMKRGYYSGESIQANMQGIVLAGLIGSGAIASASTAGAIPAHAMLSTGAAAALAAKSARVGTVVAVIAHKTSLHKLAVEAAFRLSDRAKAIFLKSLDGLFKVKPDITRTRELADSLAKLNWYADGIMGVAIDKKTEFNPRTNIYLPVSQLDTNSPIFAKNKQIYTEIVEMINTGRLTEAELSEINAFTKGATSFSSNKDSSFDKSVNYAVVIGKIEMVMDRVCAVQDNRESLKIDGAQTIERQEKRESQKHIVKPARPSVVKEAEDLVSQAEALGEAIVADPDVMETDVTVEQPVLIVEYDRIDFKDLADKAKTYGIERDKAERAGNNQGFKEYSRKFIDAQAVLHNGVSKTAIEKVLAYKNIPDERKSAYVAACMTNADQLVKAGVMHKVKDGEYEFSSDSERRILNAFIGASYADIAERVSEHCKNSIKQMAQEAPENMTVRDAMKNLAAMDQTQGPDLK